MSNLRIKRWNFALTGIKVRDICRKYLNVNAKEENFVAKSIDVKKRIYGLKMILCIEEQRIRICKKDIIFWNSGENRKRYQKTDYDAFPSEKEGIAFLYRDIALLVRNEDSW